MIRYNIFNNFTPKVLRLSFIMLVLVFTSCQKRNNALVWLYYDETYCSDVWPASTVNETLKENCVNYFKDKDITILDIEIYSDRDVENTSSCSNKTGRRFKCKVKYGDSAKLKSYNFYE